MRFDSLDQGLTSSRAARSGNATGNLDKIAGKVFLNDTRRHKKEKAPIWALSYFFSARDALRWDQVAGV
ncbi:hypothetical protein CUJ91_12905 [Paraburkholderia graminis]|jgi:hypothetical protein|uniref:hypothetical protein n=1 Tax=Paraburkholderia TaxID=1822464 RepID=UPI000D3263C3|nr:MULTISPECIES: hypothetical protein [Paraburkholderia]AXF08712.1 hypothetical protein CUJ91_12905 [Paraburkholderia graminis]